ncbi:Rieske domain-containing protein-like [Physella acuta]|uniref:Rieske domain-containing protein-like n=1 Tax=Physella acuta TaxID=109671 RepID=UPI0027DC5568|nr:Rieske domain-containing protein-like [Physella acuta]
MASADGANFESQPKPNWHLVGKVDELKQKPCRKIYMKNGPSLALFYAAPDTFFLTNSSCPHNKGPLEQGDIEDIDGRYHITCPLHFYSFDLTSGMSRSGLVLKTYQTEIRGDDLYALTDHPVSLTR